MKEEIKSLYKQLQGSKNELLIAVGLEFKIDPASVKTNWFSGLWSIPKDKQLKVLEMLKKEIESRKVTA